MEVRLFNTGYMPDGWLANRIGNFWNEFAREVDTQDKRIVPAADVVEDAEGYHFYFEMPGLRSDSLNVSVEDGTLVVEAERARPELGKDAEVRLSERTYGPIRRAFRIPEDASSDGIKAAYSDGILKVTVPKRPESKPLRIKVETN